MLQFLIQAQGKELPVWNRRAVPPKTSIQTTKSQRNSYVVTTFLRCLRVIQYKTYLYSSCIPAISWPTLNFHTTHTDDNLNCGEMMVVISQSGSSNIIYLKIIMIIKQHSITKHLHPTKYIHVFSKYQALYVLVITW